MIKCGMKLSKLRAVQDIFVSSAWVTHEVKVEAIKGSSKLVKVKNVHT